MDKMQGPTTHYWFLQVSTGPEKALIEKLCLLEVPMNDALMLFAPSSHTPLPEPAELWDKGAWASVCLTTL